MMVWIKKGSDFRQSRIGKSLISFILLSLLALTLSISWQPIARSQLPSLPSDDKELINRPRQLSGQIGNLLYAPIKIDGRPIVLVAVPSSAKAQSSDEKNLSPIQERVQRIENKLQEILKRGFDPSTLQVFPSVLNGQTIILVSDQENFKPQNIGTITDLDAELYGQGINDIAPEATKMIRAALIRAWEERQPQSLQKQAFLTLQIMAGLVAISLIFIILQNLALERIKQLKQLLSELKTQTDTPIVSPSSALVPKKRNLIDRIGDRVALLIYWFIYKGRLKNQKKSPTLDADSLPSPIKLADLIENPNQLLSLDQLKLILTRKINVLVFVRRLLIFIQLFLWLRVIAFILTLFPYTRYYGILLAGVPVSLLSIWIGILLTIKIAELLIDGSLHIWSDDLSLGRSKSNRETIRIPTVANALKGVSFVCFISLGIILSLTVFDVPIATVLAGAGILGFAVSFGSQSLIKDLIAGVINLVNDAYAVGDFVIIGSDDGLVEDMNLFVTRIRSANGDLITIPNGSVATVRNQSKDWSRVDYTIQVSYETDIPKALEIMLAIAQQLYEEPQWRTFILAPPDLKGVEDLSHEGVMIRIWLKTKPGEQWIVGRELRLRMKAAFEKAGINIGIPKQTFLWQNASDSTENNFSSSKENLTVDRD